MKRLIAFTLAAALVSGLAGPAAAKWGHGGGPSSDSFKSPVLTVQLVPASGGIAASGKGVLAVTAKGQVSLKIQGLVGSGGPITDTGSLEIDLIVNGSAVAPVTFPVPVAGGNVNVSGTLPVTGGDTFEIVDFRILDSSATDLLHAGAKVSAKAQKFSVEGTISNLGSACPTLSFDVNGVTVTTDANTTYEDGTCADLADGVKVEVNGTVQPGGSHLATKVEISNAEGDGEDD